MTDHTSPSRKSARAALSARYLSALRAHLRTVSVDSTKRAKGLGRAAVAGRLVTLDLAIMHEEAVVALASNFDFAHSRNGPLKRAGEFFTQALIPFEAVQLATRRTNRQLQERNRALHRMATALAVGNSRLKKEVARRQAGEAVVRKGKEEYRTLFLESQGMQRQLRLLTRQIISAQEEERKEISRELHDSVVQTLVGINVELSALGTGASVGLQTLKEKIARTQRLVENSVNAVHRFARELRPAVLDDLGLIPALHAFSKSLAERKKIKIQMTAFGGVEALGSAKRTVLFRVAQEALTNVARHARATQVRMSIAEKRGVIQMEISDNGRSFEIGRVLHAKNSNHLGLIGMKERLEMVGGHFSIDSAPGKGTTVRAEIPFNSRKKSR